MRLRHASAVTAAVAAAAVFLGATAADAKCQKLSFLINDYGKDGPTKDAKNLLDKYIVDIDDRGERTSQVRFQRGIVGMNFSRMMMRVTVCGGMIVQPLAAGRMNLE